MTVEAKNIPEPQTATAEPDNAQAPDVCEPNSPKHLQSAAMRAYSDQKKPADKTEMITELLPMVPKNLIIPENSLIV